MGNNEEFWIKYFQADEIERLNIIKSLPIFDKLCKDVWIGEVTPTSLNSYIEDAINSYEQYIGEYYD